MNVRFSRWVPLQNLIGSALLFGLGVAAAWYLYGVQREISARLDRNVDSTRAAQRVAIDLREIRTLIKPFDPDRMCDLVVDMLARP